MGLRMGSFEAYCFNQAVMFVGQRIEYLLGAIEDKNEKRLEQKQQRLLERLLYPGKPVSSTQFADPAKKWSEKG